MQPTETLIYDHEVLRSTLTCLETFLPEGAECACTLTRLIGSLADRLDSHTEQEERMFAARAAQSGELAAGSLRGLRKVHAQYRARLAALQDLLTQPEPASRDQIVAQGMYFAKDLREHLADEEQRVFPTMGGEAGGQAGGQAAASADDGAVEILGLA
jgi:hemerythrin-like domain-containing protein